MWLIHLILQTWAFSPEWLSLCTPLSQLQDFTFLCEIRLGFNFHLSVKRMVRLRGGGGGGLANAFQQQPELHTNWR